MSAVTIPKADPNDMLDVLVKAREWLSDPAHWTQGWYWRTAKGHRVNMAREKVAKTCAIGALSLVVDSLDGGCVPWLAEQPLLQASNGELVAINDGPDGHARVLAIYDTAIATERKRRGLA